MSKLGSFVNFKNGLNYNKEDRNKGIKVLGVANFKDKLFATYDDLDEVNSNIVGEEFLLQDNDLLFVRSNGNKSLVGRCMLVNNIKDKTSFSGFTIRGRIFDYKKCLPNYLFYYCISPMFKKELYSRIGNGTNIRNLTQSVLEDINIQLPTLDKQDTIIKMLNSITNKIEINNKINQELEKMAKTLYDYWFVQFDFPDENNRPYKSSNNKMVYNEFLKREIPKDWEVKRLGDIIVEQDKSPIQVNQVLNEGLYPFFTSGNEILKHNQYIVDGMFCYLSTGGNASVKYYYGKASYSTDTWCISANKYTYYLYNYLSSIKNQMDKLYFAGTGLKHLQKDTFKNSFILVPPNSYIEDFNNIVEKHYNKCSNCYLENQELTNLRDWLLPMLMNGQVTVNP